MPIEEAEQLLDPIPPGEFVRWKGIRFQIAATAQILGKPSKRLKAAQRDQDDE